MFVISLLGFVLPRLSARPSIPFTAIWRKLESSEQDKQGAEHWVKLIRKYTDLTELTAPLLNELIEKIVIHEGVKDDSGNRTQEVDIYYRFVGMID